MNSIQYGESAVLLAACLNDRALLELLLVSGADLEERDVVSNLFHIVTMHTCCNYPMNSNSMQWDGCTAIMKAARRGYTGIVKTLIDWGACLEAKDEVSVECIT